jgi:hypothetical protein
MKTYADIENARVSLDNVKHDFLKANGWTYTSSTPGFFWMWEKEFSGRRILVSTDHAISIQSNIDDANYPYVEPLV